MAHSIKDYGIATRFKKGDAANPHGRAKAIVQVAALAKQYTTEAITILMEIARNRKATASARVAACAHVLDRGWGRPLQAVDVKISNDDVRNLTDAQLYELIQQQRAEHRDTGEGADPAPPGPKLN